MADKIKARKYYHCKVIDNVSGSLVLKEINVAAYDMTNAVKKLSKEYSEVIYINKLDTNIIIADTDITFDV